MTELNTSQVQPTLDHVVLHVLMEKNLHVSGLVQLNPCCLRVNRVCICVCVHSHSGILLSHKRENSAIHDSMDGLKGHFAK